MRFDDRITFVQDVESYYDPIQGEYVEGEKVLTTKPCNLSYLGINRENELFGRTDRVTMVARLQRPYQKRVDYVYLNDDETKKFNVMRRSDYRKGVFYLEGING